MKKGLREMFNMDQQMKNQSTLSRQVRRKFEFRRGCMCHPKKFLTSLSIYFSAQNAFVFGNNKLNNSTLPRG